jgi:hypothetical protein
MQLCVQVLERNPRPWPIALADRVEVNSQPRPRTAHILAFSVFFAFMVFLLWAVKGE